MADESIRQIKENRKAIFELESLVWSNKDQAYLTRDLVMENRASILRNYTAAFQGNRQLSNGNTDAMFRNRMAVIRSCYMGDDQVKNNFREALCNKIKLEYLDHRSKLNEKAMMVTMKIAEANRMLVQINKEIMAMNEEVVEYNAKRIAENREMIDKGVQGLAEATVESNAKLIAENKRKIEEVRRRAQENIERNSRLHASAEEARKVIERHTEEIYERRTQIEANAVAIKQNSSACAAMIC
eukprot:RCo034465